MVETLQLGKLTGFKDRILLLSLIYVEIDRFSSLRSREDLLNYSICFKEWFLYTWEIPFYVTLVWEI